MMQIKQLFEDKTFNAEFLRMSLPIAFQTLLVGALNILDTLMVGWLGGTEIAAVGISNQIIYLLQIFLYGVGSGAGIFVAQLTGKKDQEGQRKVIALSIALAGGASLLFSVCIFVWPSQVMQLFTKDQEVISIAASYLKILSFSLLFNAVNLTYTAVLRSVGEVNLPTQINLVSFPLKIVLNLILIFGILGIEGFGADGAAMATIITRLVEFGLISTLLIKKRKDLIVKFQDFLGLSKDLVLRFIQILGTVTVKDLVWIIGTTAYVAIYGRMGSDVVVTMNILSVVQQLITVVTFGTAYSSVVMIGSKIGEKDFDGAFNYAQRFIYLNVLSSILLGLFLASFVPLIVRCFNITPDTGRQTAHILYLYALFMPILCLNSQLFAGVLRSGADNLFALIIDTIAVWVIGLSVIYLLGITFKLGIEIVFIGYVFSEVFKLLMALWRVRCKTWINNIVEDI